MREIRLTPIRDLIPDYYDGVVEIDLLQTVQQTIIDDMTERFEQLRNNLYLQLADRVGIADFEELYGIEPSGTLEQRRYAVLAKTLPPQPITYTYLQQLLTGLGLDAKVHRYSDKLHIDVYLNNINNQETVMVKTLLHRLLPANLTYTLHTNTIVDGLGDLQEQAPMVADISFEGG